jgi:hypothetical protein
MIALREVKLTLNPDSGEWEIWLNGMFDESHASLTAAIEAMWLIPEIRAVIEEES